MFASGEEGTKLIAWSNPPAQPQSPFTGRTVFMFRKDLFDDVAALASGPASVENPTPGSGECGSGNRDDEDSAPESEIESPGLKLFGSKGRVPTGSGENLQTEGPSLQEIVEGQAYQAKACNPSRPKTISKLEDPSQDWGSDQTIGDSDLDDVGWIIPPASSR